MEAASGELVGETTVLVPISVLLAPLVLLAITSAPTGNDELASGFADEVPILHTSVRPTLVMSPVG